jgi:hypothetical protein
MGLLSKDIINSDYFSVRCEMSIKKIMKWVWVDFLMLNCGFT